MEKNGSYNNQCSTIVEQQEDGSNSLVVCNDQTAKLLKVGILIVSTQLLAPFLGYMVDQVGPKLSAYIQASLCLVGLATAIISTSTLMNWLLYVAFGMISISTWIGSIQIIQLGLYFSGHTISRVIFTLNTFFDGGTITYLGLFWIQQWTQSSTSNMLIGYLVVATIIYGCALYYWTIATPEANDATSSNEKEEEEEEKPNVSCELGGDDNDGSDEKKMVTNTSSSSLGSNTPFVLLCIFFALHVTMCNWNLATQRDFLRSLGDDNHDNWYLTIFTLLTPVSILGSPLIDIIIRSRYNWNGAFQTINILGIGYMLIKVVSSNLNVQIVAFVIYSFYRSFLFGVCFSYLPTIIDGKVAGIAAGIMSFSGGLLNLFQMPLVNVAVKQNSGDFLIPNIIYLILIVPTIMIAYQIGQRSSTSSSSSAVVANNKNEKEGEETETSKNSEDQQEAQKVEDDEEESEFEEVVAEV